MSNTTNAPSYVPPRLFSRNEHGLINDGSVTYVYNDDGTINWRKMIKPQFLTPNKQVFDRRNKPLPETIDGLADDELIILLGGIKELAHARGYSSVEYTVTSSSTEQVVAVCKITWIPNYESGGRPVTYSAIGEATPKNTIGFGRIFLGPFAENRAFVRAVRSFLKVNIVGQEELSGSAQATSQDDDMATSLLEQTMNKYGVSFEKVKAKLIEENVTNAENFTCVADIPRFKQFELVERIKQKAAAAGKA